MDSTSRATVPVTCPSCRHEGPAYLYLLGRRSRCKKCRHDFLMPRNVRMGCPHCEALLRIPAEMMGREVACKFCDAAFVASPAQADGRPSRARADGARKSSPWFETDLSRVLAGHGEILSELGRLRSENDEMRRDLREIEELRAQLDRLAAVRPPQAAEDGRPAPLLRATAPTSRRPAPAVGLARIATSTNGRKAQPASKARPPAGGVSLRDLIDRLAGCEAMTDRLIARLESEQERRREDRAAFATVLERLQGELARAREDYASSPAPADDPAGPDPSTEEPPGSIALAPRRPGCGVA